MGIIHCKTKDWSIYVPPKCGTGAIDQIINFPEYEGKFYINHNEDWKPKKRRTIVYRNHVDRIASTYYEKIVDPIPGKASNLGWRQNPKEGESYGPNLAGYVPGFYENFDSWVRGLYAHSFDDHIAPYSCQSIIQSALQPHASGFNAVALPSAVCLKTDVFIDHISAELEITEHDAAIVRERWKALKNPHKIQYSHAKYLPPPMYYGAETWAEVDFENLYGCYQQHGAFPLPQYLYTPNLHNHVKYQMGYQRDLWHLLEYIPKEYQNNLCSMPLVEE